MSSWSYDDPTVIQIQYLGPSAETEVGTTVTNIANPPDPTIFPYNHPQWPLLEVNNSHYRYLWAGLRPVHFADPSVELPLPPWPTLPPPSMFYRMFRELVTPTPSLSLWPIAQTLWRKYNNQQNPDGSYYPQGSELLPLIHDYAYPYSRYRVEIIAASQVDSIPSLQSPTWTNWLEVWTLTYCDLFLGSLVKALGGAPDGWIIDTLNFAWPIVKGFITSTGSIPSLETAILKSLWTKLLKNQAIHKQIDKLVTRATLGAFGASSVDRLLAVVNILTLDLALNHHGTGTYDVQIPIHRGPQLVPTEAEIVIPSAGERAVPLKLLLPDTTQDQLDFANDSLLATFSLSADSTQLVISEMCGLDWNSISQYPGTLTLTLDQGARFQFARLSPGSVNKPLDFDAGLGAVLTADPGATGNLTAELQVDQNLFPDAPANLITLKIPFTGTSGSAGLTWDTSNQGPPITPSGSLPSIDCVTGNYADLPLVVESSISDIPIDLRQAFSAIVDIADDCSWISLRAIRAGDNPPPDYYNAPDDYGLPAIITITSDDPETADFRVSEADRASLSVGPVTIDTGLQSFLRPRREGSTTLTAKMEYLPNAWLNGPQPAAQQLEVNVTLGTALLSVTPTDIEFEDTLNADVQCTVTLPDGTTFSTTASNQMQVSASTNDLKLSDIGYEPNADDPPVSPVDIELALPDGASVQIDATKLIGSSIGTGNACEPLSGVLEAVANGHATCTVSLNANSGADVRLASGTPVPVQCHVKQAATLTLTAWCEIIDGTAQTDQPFPTNPGNPIQLWRTAEIHIKGKVGNVSAGTELTADGGGNCTILSFDKSLGSQTSGDFVIKVTDLPVGSSSITVSANKAVNFQGPATQTIGIEGLQPTIQTSLQQFSSQKPIGIKRPQIELSGTLALTVDVGYLLNGGQSFTYTFDQTDLIAANGTFSYDGPLPIDLQIGLCGVGAIASNAFGQAYLPTGWLFQAEAPIISVTLSNNILKSDTHGDYFDIDASELTADLAGTTAAAAASTQVAITLKDPSNQVQLQETVTPINFDVGQIDVSQPGTYHLTLSAENEFGPSTKTVDIRQKRLKTTVLLNMLLQPDPRVATAAVKVDFTGSPSVLVQGPNQMTGSSPPISFDWSFNYPNNAIPLTISYTMLEGDGGVDFHGLITTGVYTASGVQLTANGAVKIGISGTYSTEQLGTPLGPTLNICGVCDASQIVDGSLYLVPVSGTPLQGYTSPVVQHPKYFASALLMPNPVDIRFYCDFWFWT